MYSPQSWQSALADGRGLSGSSIGAGLRPSASQRKLLADVALAAVMQEAHVHDRGRAPRPSRQCLGRARPPALPNALSMVTSITSRESQMRIGGFGNDRDRIQTVIFGSSQSRSASPNRLKPITANEMAIPGKIATHGALSAYSCAPPLSMRPQAGVGSCTPSPR
jgi:hypothetical protein